MSSGLTPNYFLSYPVSTDPVNVASDIENLAKDIDTFLTNPAFINNINIDGGSVITSALTANVFNTNATTVNIGGAATDINIGSSSGKVDFSGDVSLATEKSYKINNVSVLSDTTLGSSVVNSSLTSVGTITSGVWSGTAIAADRGGTGITSYDIGDIVYASGTTALSKLAGVATGNSLISGGVGSAPTWGKIGLSTHVSGTLPVANGGTGVTSSTGTGNVVLSASPTLTGTPIAPTASAGTNTTQIATTQFVQTAASSILPNQSSQSGKYLTTNGSSVSWGTIDLSSYAALSGATFTGTVNVVSPTLEDSKGVRETTISTSEPTGGLDGDVWLVYA